MYLSVVYNKNVTKIIVNKTAKKNLISYKIIVNFCDNVVIM